MSLPQNMSLDMMQNTWATQLDPVVKFPPIKGSVLKNIALISGVNVINHKLGRLQQGWMVVDQDASASFYRSQPLNNLTLTLTSSGPVNVSLWVF